MKTGIPSISHVYDFGTNGLSRDIAEQSLIMEFRDEPHPVTRLRNKFLVTSKEQLESVNDFIKALGFDKL